MLDAKGQQINAGLGKLSYLTQAGCSNGQAGAGGGIRGFSLSCHGDSGVSFDWVLDSALLEDETSACTLNQ